MDPKPDAELSATHLASGWTDCEVSGRLRRAANGTIRAEGVLCRAPVWLRWDGATLVIETAGFNDYTWLNSKGVRHSPELRLEERLRPLTDGERASWRTVLRAAALRFWMSRLRDFHLPRPAQTLTPHDPTHFERILRLRRDGDLFPLP